MFNDRFSSVLKEALSRQGTASLFSGPIQSEPPPDERCNQCIAVLCGVPLRVNSGLGSGLGSRAG